LEFIATRSRDFIPEERSPGAVGYSEILDVVRNIHLLYSGSVITGLNFSDWSCKQLWNTVSCHSTFGHI